MHHPHSPFRTILFWAILSAPFSLFAQIEDAPAIFRELRVLEGTWFMPTDRGDRLELWSIADDSTYHGRGLRIKPENGDTVTLTQDLNVKGTSFTAKRGAAVRRIRLVEDNPGQIEGKVNDQTIVILTKFVKKSAD